MVTALIEYLTVILKYVNQQKVGRVGAQSHPNLATPLHGILVYVSAILKVLSLAFNTRAK